MWFILNLDKRIKTDTSRLIEYIQAIEEYS